MVKLLSHDDYTQANRSCFLLELCSFSLSLSSAGLLHLSEGGPQNLIDLNGRWSIAIPNCVQVLPRDVRFYDRESILKRITLLGKAKNK